MSETRLISGRTQIELPVQGLIQEAPSLQQLIFLHGFSDSPRSLERRLDVKSNSEWKCLIPQGLFPVPQFRAGEWKEAYSWYFRSQKRTDFLISPESVAAAISAEIAKHLDSRPIVMIGYSQGGIFAPHLARALGRRDVSLIGINTRFRSEDLLPQIFQRLFCLQAEEDEIIPSHLVTEDLQELRDKGLYVEQVTIKNHKHEISPELSAEFWRRLKLWLAPSS